MSLDKELEDLVIFAEEQIMMMAEKQKLEQALAKSMPLKFEENIQAFIKYLPNIAAEFRHHRPKNIQLFCAPSGATNIIDDLTGNPLYGPDPIKQCREQVDKLIDQPQFSSMAFGMNDDQYDTFIHTTYLRQMYDLYLDAEKNLEPIEKLPEHIGSAIVFGIGLGYHLEPLLEDVTIDHIYLCEPNRDWFFASLYCCNWKRIFEIIDERDGNIMMNIGVSYKQFTTDFINEMKNRGAFNSVNSLLYQHYPSEDVNKIILQLNEDFHMVAVGWGFYDDGVISIAHDYNNARQKLPTLIKNAKLPRKWRHMPVFIIANGPSLDNVIETILEYKEQVVVFTCGSALLPALNHGIIPDFHVALERTRFTYDYYNEFIDHDILQQINFLTVNVMHPKCAELFKWTGMAFKAAEPGTTLSVEFIDGQKNYMPMLHCNPVVANTALAYACNMGFEEIYLMGVDGGYKDPKYHHSKSSSYYNKDGSEKEILSKITRSGEFQVDGNFGEKVYATAFFHVGTTQLGHLLNMFKHVHCYNCSDGAKIENSIPLRHEDLLLMGDLPDKHEFIDFIKTDIFPNRAFDEQEYIQWLAIDEFDAMCDKLIGYVDKEFTSRSEMATALKLQVRYLYSFIQTRHRHLYFLLDGSMTYLHSVFRLIMYGFADEQKTIKVMHKAFAVFIEYMNAAKEKYHGVLTANDEQRSYLMDMLSDHEPEDQKANTTDDSTQS